MARLRHDGGFGFLDARPLFTQSPCGTGVCVDWVDIDSLRKMPVELGCLARMACTEARLGNGFPLPCLLPPVTALCRLSFEMHVGHGGPEMSA
jgi:hypothetical protein